ncbi:glycosyltransferase [Kovacikia minuta CCNUW1]|uniref:glycosyltransferase family 2 protein n=1 Tax=Kovacikia minuta TaxID=2931930 RepID=UPI001CCA6B60|nr:glycosyltransferase family 2 protein [Kovacikia minuta]UBF24882.1 glycosyltransferase [Kovacikia minuta CCNUW1]
MSSASPCVSIGLGVYNGENYLREALDSILAQTFQDFELIITDNASTDKTQEICEEYAARDQRIRYYRNERNLGASRNQSLTFELSKGKYFKLAAHDDVCAPEFLQKCVEVLEQNPDVVLCYPQTKIINEYGEIQEQYPDGKLRLRQSQKSGKLRQLLQPFLGDGNLHVNSPKPYLRFRSIACDMGKLHPVFGLIRADALRQTPLWENYGHADGVLLTRLALQGKFYEVPDFLFFSRAHAQQSCNLFRKEKGRHNYQAYAVWWDPNNAGKISVPTWKIFSEYCKTIAQADVSLQDKAWCYFDTLRWLRGNWKTLAQDLSAAWQQLTASWARRRPSIEDRAVSQ